MFFMSSCSFDFEHGFESKDERIARECAEELRDLIIAKDAEGIAGLFSEDAYDSKELLQQDVEVHIAKTVVDKEHPEHIGINRILAHRRSDKEEFIEFWQKEKVEDHSGIVIYNPG